MKSLCEALGCDTAEFVQQAITKELERWAALLQDEPSRAFAEARRLFESVAPRPNWARRPFGSRSCHLTTHCSGLGVSRCAPSFSPLNSISLGG